MSDDLELLTLLHPPLECWSYRCALTSKDDLVVYAVLGAQAQHLLQVQHLMGTISFVCHNKDGISVIYIYGPRN